MHPHTKFGILALKNIEDMHRTQSRADGRTDGLAYGLYASLRVFAGIKTKCTCIPMKQNNSNKGYVYMQSPCPYSVRLCHRCKIHTRCKIYRGGDYVHVAKIQGGIMSTYTKMRRGVCRGDFCPTLC